MSDRDTMTYTYYQKNVKPKPETEGKKGFVCKICGYIYEGDIYYQQKEYEFEIDANNGSFLKWSEERD